MDYNIANQSGGAKGPNGAVQYTDGGGVLTKTGKIIFIPAAMGVYSSDYPIKDEQVLLSPILINCKPQSCGDLNESIAVSTRQISNQKYSAKTGGFRTLSSFTYKIIRQVS